MTLERQIDVVANNVANVNTTGFKAERMLFEEYLNSGAHEDNFQRPDRRVSYVQDRGTYRDFSQGPLVPRSCQGAAPLLVGRLGEKSGGTPLLVGWLGLRLRAPAGLSPPRSRCPRTDG